MLKLIYAEHRKLAHTFGKKLPFLVLVLNLLLALWLTGSMGKYLPASAWNWWYIMLLPGMMSVFCYLCVKKDKKIKYFHVFTLQTAPEKSWIAKIIYCILGMLFSNLVTFWGHGWEASYLERLFCRLVVLQVLVCSVSLMHGAFRCFCF